MAEIEELTDFDEWQLMWEAQKAEDAGALLIFKSSPACSLSQSVEVGFKRFVAGLPASSDLRIVRVDVIAARELAREIARVTGIKHESPQALLISRDQNVIWHASHSQINETTLTEALSLAKV